MLRKLGFAREDCVAAGDSNNDAAMLHSGIAFVLVANHNPNPDPKPDPKPDPTPDPDPINPNPNQVANASGDLVRAAEAAPQPHHYRASAGHADGCVEGIQHFRPS